MQQALQGTGISFRHWLEQQPRFQGTGWADTAALAPVSPSLLAPAPASSQAQQTFQISDHHFLLVLQFGQVFGFFFFFSQLRRAFSNPILHQLLFLGTRNGSKKNLNSTSGVPKQSTKPTEGCHRAQCSIAGVVSNTDVISCDCQYSGSIGIVWKLEHLFSKRDLEFSTQQAWL